MHLLYCTIEIMCWFKMTQFDQCVVHDKHKCCNVHVHLINVDIQKHWCSVRRTYRELGRVWRSCMGGAISAKEPSSWSASSNRDGTDIKRLHAEVNKECECSIPSHSQRLALCTQGRKQKYLNRIKKLQSHFRFRNLYTPKIKSHSVRLNMAV